MNIENHERARKLLASRRIEGISSAEETWLDDHLAQCDDCSKEADTLALAINSLRAFSVTARPEAVRRASSAVRMRAEQRQHEPRGRDPRPAGQLGFLMWWFLPASVVAAVAARQKIVSNRESL